MLSSPEEMDLGCLGIEPESLLEISERAVVVPQLLVSLTPVEEDFGILSPKANRLRELCNGWLVLPLLEAGCAPVGAL
jgi:hypothetical protein